MSKRDNPRRWEPSSPLEGEFTRVTYYGHDGLVYSVGREWPAPPRPGPTKVPLTLRKTGTSER